MSEQEHAAGTATAKTAEEQLAADGLASQEANTGSTLPSKSRRSVSRRTLLFGVGGAAALLGLGALKYVGHHPLCRPPGGQDESHVVAACIRCQRCYEACPRKIIVPAHIEDGLLGMRTPALNFDDNFCDFCQEENGGSPLCVNVCPTEALKLSAEATAQGTIIGLAVINESQCLAFRDTGCRDCFDACPYEAIELTDVAQNPLPVVVADRCNGCGACESVCVSLKAGALTSGATQRAIVVEPLAALK